MINVMKRVIFINKNDLLRYISGYVRRIDTTKTYNTTEITKKQLYEKLLWLVSALQSSSDNGRVKIEGCADLATVADDEVLHS